jgi:hypothetical protein
LGLAGLFVAGVLRDPAGAEPSAGLLPEGLWAPGISSLHHLDGSIASDGTEMETLVFTTSASPGEVVDHFRAQWEDRAVEWVEAELPDGRALTVLDFHEGMRWTLVAREARGSTEVIRSVGRGSGADDEPTPPPLDLPEALGVVSHTRDRVGGLVVDTWVAVVEHGGDALSSLCEGARTHGWEGDCAFPAGEGLAVFELRRASESLVLGVGDGPLGRRWATIRWERP